MISKIISDLKSVADPNRKEALKKMIPTSMESLGVRTPEMRNLFKKWWEELKLWSPEKLIKLSKGLVDRKNFEANQVAFELLWKNKSALGQLTLNDLQYLGKNMDNWATTDTFSVLLSGWAWRNKQISDSDVLSWLNSESFWWRRAAIVSTVPLNLRSRGGTGDTKRTLMICEKVIHERDDMIVKALSWALRELSKSDKKAVEIFIQKNKSKLASRVIREVNHKLKTGKKN